jgi:aspartyl-tRNA(Asn)/glutamyl-tRNA(Gln) amidotransferase subunit C
MSLTPEQVAAIAHLARLRIDERDIDAFAGSLSGIIDFVAQLEQADTGSVEPMAHPLDMAQRMRADEVTERDDRALFQRNAPATDGGLYLVPKVLE